MAGFESWSTCLDGSWGHTFLSFPFPSLWLWAEVTINPLPSPGWSSELVPVGGQEPLRLARSPLPHPPLLSTHVGVRPARSGKQPGPASSNPS